MSVPTSVQPAVRPKRVVHGVTKPDGGSVSLLAAAEQRNRSFVPSSLRAVTEAGRLNKPGWEGFTLFTWAAIPEGGTAADADPVGVPKFIRRPAILAVGLTGNPSPYFPELPEALSCVIPVLVTENWLETGKPVYRSIDAPYNLDWGDVHPPRSELKFDAFDIVNELVWGHAAAALMFQLGRLISGTDGDPERYPGFAGPDAVVSPLLHFLIDGQRGADGGVPAQLTVPYNDDFPTACVPTKDGLVDLARVVFGTAHMGAGVEFTGKSWFPQSVPGTLPWFVLRTNILSPQADLGLVKLGNPA